MLTGLHSCAYGFSVSANTGFGSFYKVAVLRAEKGDGLLPCFFFLFTKSWGLSFKQRLKLSVFPCRSRFVCPSSSLPLQSNLLYTCSLPPSSPSGLLYTLFLYFLSSFSTFHSHSLPLFSYYFLLLPSPLLLTPILIQRVVLIK